MAEKVFLPEKVLNEILETVESKLLKLKLNLRNNRDYDDSINPPYDKESDTQNHQRIFKNGMWANIE